jgi:hypothetical protein
MKRELLRLRLKQDTSNGGCVIHSPDSEAGSDLDDPPVMYWFKLVRKPGGQVEFVPHLNGK